MGAGATGMLSKRGSTRTNTQFIFNDVNNLKMSLKKSSALVQPLFGTKSSLSPF